MEATAKDSITAAGIDLGSNSFRLLVAKVGNGKLAGLVKKLETVRLAQGLSKGSKLAESSMERALTALSSFREILEQFPLRSKRVCATAALRAADNTSDFLERANDVLGLDIEVISGKEEAELNVLGVFSRMPRPDGPMLLVDVGGGSTELVFCRHPQASAQIWSLPLGAVGLTEKFSGAEEMASHIKEIFLSETGLQPILNPSLSIIATGGTATALAALDLDLARYDEDMVQGHKLFETKMEVLFGRLSRLTAAECNILPGLEQGRGDIILAGVKIYQILLALAVTNQMIISDAGLLEGVLLSGVSSTRHEI